MESVYIPLGGGVDGRSPLTQQAPGRLRVGSNVECKSGGGYRRIEGYSKFDDDVVPGEGKILGVHYYNGRVYAFRNAVGGATAVMHESTGSGWTAKKTGLTPDGHYRCINYAFSGTQNMYGVSGVHKAFQWDGTTWTDLTTGMASDTPDHITAHKKHLFLSFGNSVQHSSLGDPTTWSAVTGAGEILLPRNVTGFSTMPNGSLGIFSREGIVLLAGTSSTDWVANNLVEYGNNAGALPDTIMPMGSAVRFVDSRGVIDLAASDTSSDFADAIISRDLDNLLEGEWVTATCATVVRAKNQYRVFLSDGTGVILVFGGGGVMPTRIAFPDVVRCVVNTEDAAGNELIYFGSDDGFIYQMEDGRSFGGENIVAYAETSFTDLGAKHNVKRFRRGRFDVGRNGNESFVIAARFIIDDNALRRMQDEALGFEGTGVTLGESATLGSTILGALPLVEGQAELPGQAQYISFIFKSDANDDVPWEIDGVSLDYMVGRRRR